MTVCNCLSYWRRSRISCVQVVWLYLSLVYRVAVRQLSRCSGVKSNSQDFFIFIGWISFMMPSGFFTTSSPPARPPALCVSQCTQLFEASRWPLAPGWHDSDSGFWLADWQLDCLPNYLFEIHLSAGVTSPKSHLEPFESLAWVTDKQSVFLIHFSLCGLQWSWTVDSLSVGLLCNSDWVQISSVCYNPNWLWLHEGKLVLYYL